MASAPAAEAVTSSSPWGALGKGCSDESPLLPTSQAACRPAGGKEGAGGLRGPGTEHVAPLEQGSALASHLQPVSSSFSSHSNLRGPGHRTPFCVSEDSPSHTPVGRASGGRPRWPEQGSNRLQRPRQLPPGLPSPHCGSGHSPSLLHDEAAEPGAF